MDYRFEDDITVGGTTFECVFSADRFEDGEIENVSLISATVGDRDITAFVEQVRIDDRCLTDIIVEEGITLYQERRRENAA